MTTYKRVSGDYVIQSLNSSDTVQIDSNNVGMSGNLTAQGNVAGSNISASVALKTAVFADSTARDAAIPSPAAGMIVYVTSVAKFQGYVGTPTNAWQNLN